MGSLLSVRLLRPALLAALTFAGLSVAPSPAAAQTTPPANTVIDGDGYKPAPGYVWVAPGVAGDFRVKWKPGTAHPDQPNVVAGPNEKKWNPAPGYKWKTAANDDLRVEWNPGARHPDFPGVVAQSGEGKWTTAPGYKWLNNTPGDLRTVAAGGTGNSGSSGGNWTFDPPSGSSGGNWNFGPSGGTSTSGYTPGGATAPDVGKAVGKILAAGLANAIAQQDDEGDLGRAVLIGLARKARDELIQSALADAFPNLPAADRRTLGHAAGLALDGRLTTGNLREAQAKDSLKEWLKKQNPDMKYAVEGADLLYGIIRGR